MSFQVLNGAIPGVLKGVCVQTVCMNVCQFLPHMVLLWKSILQPDLHLHTHTDTHMQPG